MLPKYQLDLFSKEIRVPSEHDGYWHEYRQRLEKERALANMNGKKEKKEATVDLVNHPPHYNKGGMEVIEVIELVTGGKTGGKRTGDQGFVGYLLGNILKYLLRFEHKNKDNPVEDLKKARWYLDKLISVVSDKEKPTPG